MYCYYDGTREVAPGYKRSKFDSLPFGAHMDIPTLMEKQVRIERQEEPTVSAASVDRFAAHSFQAYVQSALNFSIQRGAILYGRVDEEAKEVHVDVAYEPPQQGGAERLELDLECEEVCSFASAPCLALRRALLRCAALANTRLLPVRFTAAVPLRTALHGHIASSSTGTPHGGVQAHRAGAIAAALGLTKVGLLFNQSAGERDYIMNDSEIALACRVQAEVGEHGVTAVFMQQEEEDGTVRRAQGVVAGCGKSH